ncbi:MAG: phosphate ABC transporter permease subunit PstC [Myxococcota bacterium]
MGALLLLAIVALTATAYVIGRRHALAVVDGVPHQLHSRPGYYGFYVALWCGLPAIAFSLVWIAFDGPIVEGLVAGDAPAEIAALPPDRFDLWMNDVRNLASGSIAHREPDEATQRAVDRYESISRIGDWALAAGALALAVAGLAWSRQRISADLRARNAVERTVMALLAASSTLAILVTAGIVLSLLFEAMQFFALVPVGEFLFGTHWSPQTALRADQVGSSGSFGAIPVFAGTLLVTLIAMAVAGPIGLLSAIYLSEYAGPTTRAWVKPLLEILAGIPTVVYGFFAALSVAPWVRVFGETLGMEVAAESALAAGLVMGVMIIPFVSSLSDDVINAVPDSLREGSLGLGATRSETIRQVVLPAALPGIVGSLLLAISRAIGETMIVVMAAGLAANLTANPLEAVTTVTVQIVTLLVGDQEFDSAKTLAAFALGLMLFLVTLVLNIVALSVVRRYREKYD